LPGFIDIGEHLLFFFLQAFQAALDFGPFFIGTRLLESELKFLETIVQVLLTSREFLQPAHHLQLLAALRLRALRFALVFVAIFGLS
jgi:hypothetical protein